MDASLPASVKAALARLSQGHSRNALAARASAISNTYRQGGGSTAIASPDDALAYALARMPATYAAVTASLAAVRAARPGLTLQSLLDAGAGPGTASFAAIETFPSLATITLIDANPALRALARELMQDIPNLAASDYRQADARTADCPQADLVIASYVIGEMPQDAYRTLADKLWAATLNILLIVEPGTPAGYTRCLDVRTRLVAAGAHVIAPCPHNRPCPLSPPDWCHFAQRLPRSRDHKHLKSANVPFEDEKFSYVALSRTPATQRADRVLAEPAMTKAAIVAKMCTSEGLSHVTVARRDKTAFAAARRWRWGDQVPEQGRTSNGYPPDETSSQSSKR